MTTKGWSYPLTQKGSQATVCIFLGFRLKGVSKQHRPAITGHMDCPLSVAKPDRLGSDSATDLLLGSLPFSHPVFQEKQQDAFRVTQVSDFSIHYWFRLRSDF